MALENDISDYNTMTSIYDQNSNEYYYELNGKKCNDL